MIRHLVAVSAMLSLFTPAIALAQNFSEGLEGLREMELVVERMSSQSEQCGLERNALSDVVRNEIKDTGLSLAEGGPTLYLNINSAVVGQVCFSSVTLSVHYYTQVPHPAKPEGAIAQVVLWDDAFVASSEAGKHKKYIEDLTREMTKDFVDDWRAANPRLLLPMPDGPKSEGPAKIYSTNPNGSATKKTTEHNAQ